mmetsp:Transcript_64/g.210  ORF Transcript_64/g.210 Transcript_64/m.210 type:complete len:122 (-) Transcript_64:9-374(-)
MTPIPEGEGRVLSEDGKTEPWDIALQDESLQEATEETIRAAAYWREGALEDELEFYQAFSFSAFRAVGCRARTKDLQFAYSSTSTIDRLEAAQRLLEADRQRLQAIGRAAEKLLSHLEKEK